MIYNNMIYNKKCYSIISRRRRDTQHNGAQHGDSKNYGRAFFMLGVMFAECDLC